MVRTYPLNVAQKRGVRNWRREGLGIPFNERTLSLPEPVDRDVVVNAIQDLAKRVEALRSRPVRGADGGVEGLRVQDDPTSLTVETADLGALADELRSGTWSAVFGVPRDGDGLVRAISIYTSHLVVDGLAADALRRALEVAVSGAPVEVSGPGVGLRPDEVEAATRFWISRLSGAPRSTPCHIGADRDSGSAWVASVGIADRSRRVVQKCVSSVSVLPSSVWLAAVSLTLWEAASCPDQLVTRGTASNRLGAGDETAIDYRAQAVFIPVELRRSWSVEKVLRSCNGRNMRALLRGRYDAVEVIDRLNRLSNLAGSSFQPAVELNFLPDASFGDPPAAVSTKKVPFTFSPTSAKADVAVLVTKDQVRVTHRLGGEADAVAVLDRILWWLDRLGEEHESVGSLTRTVPACAEDGDVRPHRSGLPVVEELLPRIVPADVGIDLVDGQVVCRWPRDVEADDVVAVLRRQSALPGTVVPDIWVLPGRRADLLDLAALVGDVSVGDHGSQEGG